MKRIIIVFLLCTLLFACVPTPEKEFIVNKGDDAAWQSASEQGSLSETNNIEQSISIENNTTYESVLYERIDAPRTWTLDETKGKVRIVCNDSPVILPTANRVPAVEAKRRSFTQEDVETVASAFFQSQQLSWYPYGIQTKEAIAERIRFYQELLPSAEDQAHADYWMEQIQLLTDSYSNALSQDDIPQIALKLDSSSGTYQGLRAWTMIDGERWNIMVDQNYGKQRIVISTGKDGTVEYDGNPIVDSPYHVELSKEDAIKQANTLVASISNDYSLCFCGPSCAYFAQENDITRNWGWGMVYMRCINNFPSAFSSKEPGDRGEVTDMPPYERIFVVIDDQGFIYFEWQTPMEITHILSTDETLLSFNDASSNAKNMIASHWTYNIDRDPCGYVRIDKVKLGLCRIAKKGGDYYYVPAYYFFTDFVASEEYKSQYYVDETHNDDRIVMEAFNGYVDPLGFYDEYNVIVINALDGTLIDLANGY